MDLSQIDFSVSSDEKKHLAEFSTPLSLIEQMLDTIPEEFWSQPRRVFEPCAGKGAIVFSLFNRFLKD